MDDAVEQAENALAAWDREIEDVPFSSMSLGWNTLRGVLRETCDALVALEAENERKQKALDLLDHVLINHLGDPLSGRMEGAADLLEASGSGLSASGLRRFASDVMVLESVMVAALKEDEDVRT